MSIIHRLNSIFSYKEKKVDGAEVWMVYWNTYISNGLGMRYPEVKRLSKAFFFLIKKMLWNLKIT